MTNNSSIKLRSFFVFLFFGLLYAIIIFNLYLIQIRDTDFFTQLGSQQYNITLKQSPARAPIVDRNNKFLAINHDCLSAFILPNKLTNPTELKKFLAQHFPHALEQLNSKKRKQFMYIQRKLSPEQIALIKEAQIPDIQLLHESNRFYPVPSTGSIIGRTDIDNNGLMGIELSCNSILAGTASTVSLQKDARSGLFYFKKETKKQGTDGEPIKLTIDSNLQFLVHEELKKAVATCGSQLAAALIMDPKTGEILSMATWPDFDPNSTEPIAQEQTKNNAITDAYELGSVIKVFAGLAALEEGVVTADELIDCKNSKTAYIDGRKINTWKENGLIPFTEVITSSNNIGIAIIAKRIGPALYTHYTNLGFGKKTGIPLPGEQKGFVNHPDNWSKQSIISLSYGYEISATLLQIGCAFCTIARNGYLVTPKLLLDNTPIPMGAKIYSDQNIATIKDILERTTLTGTSRKAQIKGYRIMSKTGTANLLIDGEYNKVRNIYTCAGIIEKDNYERVLVAFVKETTIPKAYASMIAAPLFEKIAEKMLIHDRVI
jgi:cell division protein FtsI (penicillin-binding protein 3)